MYYVFSCFKGQYTLVCGPLKLMRHLMALGFMCLLKKLRSYIKILKAIRLYIEEDYEDIYI